MKLSIIISNRNDLSMLNVTIRSAIEEMRPIRHLGAEIVIVDNSDSKFYNVIKTYIPAGYLRDKTVRLYRQSYPCLFTAREKAIKESKGEYILCVDSHMLFGHDSIKDMVAFMEERKSDRALGFCHAPISWAHQHERMARHDRDMSTCELGNWGAAYKYPQKITWKGMPWICRRSLWSAIGGYGALSEHRLSWGGGDMHIGLKPWLLGYANWAIPCSPIIHIGPFPNIKNVKTGRYSRGMDKYRHYGTSGVGPSCLGFLVACYIIGGEQMMLRNRGPLKKRFGKFINVNAVWNQAKSMGQREKDWLDKAKKTTFEQLITNRPWDEESRNSTVVAIAGAR